MSFDDLWIGYFAFGGVADPETVRSYLGGSELPSLDYDILAAALNERFASQGDNHPVPYHDGLP